jgi:hypothetical protein
MMVFTLVSDLLSRVEIVEGALTSAHPLRLGSDKGQDPGQQSESKERGRNAER